MQLFCQNKRITLIGKNFPLQVFEWFAIIVWEKFVSLMGK